MGVTKSLFLIEAPFQLLSAYEAICDYKILQYTIIIRLSNIEDNDLQLKKLVTILFENDKQVKYIYLSAKNKSLIEYFMSLYYITYFCVYQIKFSKIFFGNLESGFLSKIIRFTKHNKIILLDDGIKSIIFQNKFSENNFYNLYTMLDDLKYIANQEIVINKFNRLHKLLKSIDYTDNIMFIGSKLSEIGIIEETYYIELIKKIAVQYAGKKIEYIPHRGERKEKLLKIAQINNIEVIKLEYPLEFYPLYSSLLPRTIVSFYSAALISMRKLYPKSMMIAYKFDFTNYEQKENIEKAYEYLTKYMKVIDLNV
jgi:hypothetical protein